MVIPFENLLKVTSFKLAQIGRLLCSVAKLICAGKMNTTDSSRYSIDSAFDCEESSLNIKLNTAMLVSTDEEISSGDEIFYDANKPSPFRSVKMETDASIESEAGHTSQLSHIFEHTDSTSLISLPNTRCYSDNKNVVNCTEDSLQGLHTTQHTDLPCEQYTDPEKQNYKTNKHLPLNVILKRMFDDILGRRTNLAKKSNTTFSSKTSSNEMSLNSDNVSTTMPSDIVDTNNNMPLCRAPKYDENTSIESIKDSSEDDTSSQNISTFFLNRFFSKKLVTILENSNENTANTDTEESLDHSGKCIGRLANCHTKIESKHCMFKTIFNTTDVEDSESDASSDVSTNIAIMSERILQKANTVHRSDYSEKFKPQNPDKEAVDITGYKKDYNTLSDISLETRGTDGSVENETHDSSIQNKTNSLWISSELEESDYSSTFPSTSKCDYVELSTTNQSSYKEMDNTVDSAIDVEHNAQNIKEIKVSPLTAIIKIQQSPFNSLSKNTSCASPNVTKKSRQRLIRSPSRKKSWKKRRSLSLPEDVIKAKNNKTPNKRLNDTSSPLKGGRNSHCIITSPIKPVEYLVTWFDNIANKKRKSMKLSPTVHKLRRPRIPFISVTCATPK